MKILVVDDQKINRMLVEALVKASGHEVVLAESGREAIYILRSDLVDLVLMDIEMPDMNGVEVTQKIRGNNIIPDHIPIIALTAHTAADETEKYIAAGMQGYLPKPLKPEMLTAIYEQFDLL